MIAASRLFSAASSSPRQLLHLGRHHLDLRESPGLLLGLGGSLQLGDEALVVLGRAQEPKQCERRHRVDRRGSCGRRDSFDRVGRRLSERLVEVGDLEPVSNAFSGSCSASATRVRRASSSRVIRRSSAARARSASMSPGLPESARSISMSACHGRPALVISAASSKMRILRRASGLLRLVEQGHQQAVEVTGAACVALDGDDGAAAGGVELDDLFGDFDGHLRAIDRSRLPKPRATFRTADLRSCRSRSWPPGCRGRCAARRCSCFVGHLMPARKSELSWSKTAPCPGRAARRRASVDLLIGRPRWRAAMSEARKNARMRSRMGGLRWRRAARCARDRRVCRGAAAIDQRFHAPRVGGVLRQRAGGASAERSARPRRP